MIWCASVVLPPPGSAGDQVERELGQSAAEDVVEPGNPGRQLLDHDSLAHGVSFAVVREDARARLRREAVHEWFADESSRGARRIPTRIATKASAIDPGSWLLHRISQARRTLARSRRGEPRERHGGECGAALEQHPDAGLAEQPRQVLREPLERVSRAVGELGATPVRREVGEEPDRGLPEVRSHPVFPGMQCRPRRRSLVHLDGVVRCASQLPNARSGSPSVRRRGS